jgi:hypothetical protein
MTPQNKTLIEKTFLKKEPRMKFTEKEFKAAVSALQSAEMSTNIHCRYLQGL